MKPPPRGIQGGGGGFSLTELLVSTAVVLVLGALAAPAIEAGRHRVRSVQCTHHLGQWGLATRLYADANDDRLPPEGPPNPGQPLPPAAWYVQLPEAGGLIPYDRHPWRTNAAAPLQPTPWLCPGNPRRSNGRNLFHYCLNQDVNGTGIYNRTLRIYDIPTPARVPWLFDSKNLPAVGPASFLHTNVHSGRPRLLFLDGHTESIDHRAHSDPETGRWRFPGELRWRP